ncbi:hypothetical protein [Micromonospora sp. NPDC092111]|uniref:hypothetical protein n=1 Tax=Micromonospora sp. NPDC092111 TaxID=3364289 RepID=UPI0038255874
MPSRSPGPRPPAAGPSAADPSRARAPAAGPARVDPARAGRRPGWLVTAAVLGVGAVLLTVGWAGRQDAPVGDRTVGQVERVGVAPGDALPGYVAAAATELTALTAGAYALVPFDAYLTPDRLPALLAGVEVSAVITRVPLPDRQTEVIRLPARLLPGDVTAGMAGAAARKDREAADYRIRAAGTADPELRRVYDTGARVAAREADAYRSACGCVYAAVVRAEPAALRALAGRAGVRAVDPAPEVTRLDRTVFTPPLPEQRDVARPPADTALAPTRSVGDSSEAAPAVIGSVRPGPGAGSDPPPPTPVPTSPDSRRDGSPIRSP